MKLSVPTTIGLIISVILLLLFGTLGFSLFTIRELKANLAVQVDTRTAIVKLKDNLTELLNAETGERGFVITGDTMYLAPYHNSLKTVELTINELRELNRANVQQQKDLDSLVAVIRKKMLYIKDLISLKKQGKDADVKELLIEGKGKIYMDSVRAINERMQAQEEKVFAERQIATAESIERARIVFISEAIFSLVATLFLAAVIIHELNKRARAEQTLKQANYDLEIRNKEIEQFAYVASHDLQEPLRTISNFTTLLSSKLAPQHDSDAQRYMQTIVNGTTRMSALIFDLLEYSRIGKDMTKSSIDCNKLVTEVLTDMQAAIKESKATVNSGALPTVQGYIYLKSMFQNLISNGIKFHKPGQTPVVEISATDDGDHYTFKIADNGIGIEKQFYERIFIMFQRLHTRSEYPGTGIGLAQCKKIADLHKGKIWVESHDQQGSTFFFTIPK